MNQPSPANMGCIQPPSMQNLLAWLAMDEETFLQQAPQLSNTTIMYRHQIQPLPEEQLLSIKRVQERLWKLTVQRFQSKDRENRKWVEDHGSPSLQAEVKAYPGFLVDCCSELIFLNVFSDQLGLPYRHEPYFSYLQQRLQKEHPLAIFTPCLTHEPVLNPTNRDLECAREWGGQLVQLDHYPDPMDESNPFEHVLKALFQPPATAVAIPFLMGHVLYFIKGAPEHPPGTIYTVLCFPGPSGTTRTLVMHCWNKMLYLTAQKPLRVPLAVQQLQGLDVEVFLAVTPTGEDFTGHYQLVSKTPQGDVLYVSPSTKKEDLLRPYQLVSLQKLADPVNK